MYETEKRPNQQSSLQQGTALHGYNRAGPSGADIIKTSS